MLLGNALLEGMVYMVVCRKINTDSMNVQDKRRYKNAYQVAKMN